jgi:hypothetical protein
MWNLDTMKDSFRNQFIQLNPTRENAPIIYKTLISNIPIHGHSLYFYIPWNFNYSHICGLSLCCCQFNCNLHFAVCALVVDGYSSSPYYKCTLHIPASLAVFECTVCAYKEPAVPSLWYNCLWFIYACNIL